MSQSNISKKKINYYEFPLTPPLPTLAINADSNKTRAELPVPITAEMSDVPVISLTKHVTGLLPRQSAPHVVFPRSPGRLCTLLFLPIPCHGSKIFPHLLKNKNYLDGSSENCKHAAFMFLGAARGRWGIVHSHFLPATLDCLSSILLYSYTMWYIDIWTVLSDSILH